MKINIDTWFDPETQDAKVRIEYTIPSFAIISSSRVGGLKGGFLKVFRNMQLVTFDFIRELIMSEKGFRGDHHEESFNETRMLTQKNGVDYIEAEICDEG